jgi:transglutaminase-like putative cysteine protease
MSEKRLYRIEHLTQYRYSAQAALSMNQVCLRARESGVQTTLDHSFRTSPQADYFQDSLDYFGNHHRLFAFQKPHTTLDILSDHLVEIRTKAGLGGVDHSRPDPFLYASPYVPLGEAYAALGRPHFTEYQEGKEPLTAGLLSLMAEIYSRFEYDPKVTDISTPVAKVLEIKRGVCQDFAHLMLAVLRSLKIPARYVSGYLNTLPPPGKEKILGADASHAWVSAYTPEEGWIDLDPTNNLAPSLNHIAIAWGRDYGDVTPIRGVVLGGGEQTLEVKVSVISLDK